ncbi:hypothetical protein CPC08DRAFT_761679 [Agrocybe pediades]|nr:hypothetical protein CPC08DRAFT_761679 [Agrocybe pediades]
MRFRAPRSVSSSPVRGNSYGLASDSDSEDYNSELESSFHDSDIDDDISVASSSSSSSSSYNLVSNIGQLSIRPKHIKRTPQEERLIEETVSAIRARAKYHDPYEEWEHEARRDAFREARKQFTEKEIQLMTERERLNDEREKRRLADHEWETEQVRGKLKVFVQKVEEIDKALIEGWKARDQALWDRVELAIKQEEEKVARKLEEERKLQEEEDRLRKEIELKRKLAAEKREREEAKRKEEEEKRARLEKEQQQQAQKEKDEAKKKIDDDIALRTRLRLATPAEDWAVARNNLQMLKNGPLAWVKEHKPQKSEWSAMRRQITPKIGQLTNDLGQINRITQQIIDVMQAADRSAERNSVYPSLASSLAKAILLQAETEVVAEKRAAIPLAQVTFNLLQVLPDFGSIFFSKLVQRSGGWPIPIVVPNHDNEKRPWKSNEEFTKVSGWRKSSSGDGSESPEEHVNRISALMRVYFNILKLSCASSNLYDMFQMPRCWIWFARIMNNKQLLDDPLAAQLIYIGLDVLGFDALKIFGNQWVKMLMLVNNVATDGFDDGKLLGGDTPIGAAACARVKLAIESILKGEQS